MNPVAHPSEPLDASLHLETDTVLWNKLNAKASTPTFADSLILSTGPSWEAYIEHPFIIQLEAGTLPLSCFIYFIRQGYRFLLHYARAYAIAAHKARSMESLAASNAVIQSCVKEVEKNIVFCRKHGISKEELDATPEGVVTIAYSRYILDLALTGDALDMQIALLPCLLGYAIIGTRLLNKTEAEVDRTEDNPFYKWISEYSGGEYQSYAAEGCRQLELAFNDVRPSATRTAELWEIFARATNFEIAFWDAAMKAKKL